MNELPQAVEVAIVGGGVAGLAVARSLSRAGLSSSLLEAAPALGGRIRTLRRPGWALPIELGAEFVHGRPSPTFALGQEALELVRVPERRVRGGPAPQPLHDTWSRFAELLQGARDAPPDGPQSLLDYLERQQIEGPDRELVRMIVEGYHATTLRDVSALSIAQDAANGSREQYRTASGYDRVIALLEAGIDPVHCRAHLGVRVRRIAWSRGRVRLLVDAAHGPAEVLARCAVVTCSLGVLQAGPEDGLAFDPLPPAFARALPRLAMGDAQRVVLCCEQAPWVGPLDGSEVQFVHAPGAAFETFWRQRRTRQTQIVAWAGGPRARALAHESPDERVRLALESLALASASSVAACRRALLEAHCHDFVVDPLVRGAYSYVRPGGEQAARALSEPCEDALFFAGEALDLQYPGTVAGALGSGEHCARQVLASLRG